VYFVQVFMRCTYRDKKVVGVFVRCGAPHAVSSLPEHKGCSLETAAVNSGLGASE
jgi:hypothetical protein